MTGKDNDIIKILLDMNSDGEAGFDAYSGNVIGPATRLSVSMSRRASAVSQ